MDESRDTEPTPTPLVRSIEGVGFPDVGIRCGLRTTGFYTVGYTVLRNPDSLCDTVTVRVGDVRVCGLRLGAERVRGGSYL